MATLDKSQIKVMQGRPKPNLSVGSSCLVIIIQL